MATIRDVFLGLALLLILGGAIGHQWVLSEQDSEQQALSQQQEKFKTRVVEAGKVLDRELKVKPFSGEIIDENLQDEPEAKEPAARSNIRIISYASLAAGLTITAGWLLALIAHYVPIGLRRLKEFLSYAVKRLKELCGVELIKGFLKKCKNTLWKIVLALLGKLKKKCLAILSRIKAFFTRVFKVLFWLPNKLSNACLAIVRGISLSKTYYNKKHKLRVVDPENQAQKIDTMYCDEKSAGPKAQKKEQKGAPADLPQLDPKLLGQMEQNIRKTILAGYYKSSLDVQNSLKNQNANIEKQVAEVMQMAQSIQEASSKNSEPVKSSIDELTRQISAIREYTSLQHSKMEKLQEGYDWNIIRNFCLRVIRCIDNLENRITKLSEQSMDTTDLEEIMDELVFALESSGVEQFRPELNSDYNGKEKAVEVTKDKICPADPKLRGKIAEVIRPGYQYIIGETNVRVVRTAQVKLFG
jgi:molecular chaperone GrpE (heat shock protein)